MRVRYDDVPSCPCAAGAESHSHRVVAGGNGVDRGSQN